VEKKHFTWQSADGWASKFPRKTEKAAKTNNN